MSSLTYEDWFPTHTPWGTRTYLDVPVDEHPATARLRAHLAALQETVRVLKPGQQVGGTVEAIAEAEREIRRFEAGEYEARGRRWLRALDLGPR